MLIASFSPVNSDDVISGHRFQLNLCCPLSFFLCFHFWGKENFTSNHSLTYLENFLQNSCLNLFISVTKSWETMTDSAIPVRVAVRARPLSEKEETAGCQDCVMLVPGRPQILIKNSDKAFTFDYAFAQVFEFHFLLNLLNYAKYCIIF